MKMKRILIAEDDQFLANICREKFEEGGFKTEVALDGRLAIELLRRSPPDVVLLDLMLPEVDGISVLRFIRSEQSLRALPVMVLSNSSYFSGLAQSAWNAGATGFLNKGDCGPKVLLEEVKKLLAKVESEKAPRAWDNPPPLPPRAFIKRADGPIRVLVVDDDKVIQGVLGFFMEQAGYVVRSVFNGRRALEMAEEYRPDIMVLDGMMPELDGFEVLKIWQRHPRLARIPVIMLSAAKEEIKNAHAAGAGAVEYLTKPFSPDRLVALVNQYVGPNARIN